MAINIKDPTTDRLARELAAVTGESITDAVRVAMEERLDRLRRRQRRAGRHVRLSGYIVRARARPDLDSRSAEEIIGYDEHGLPR
ncbi:type II toxin-antitoxin system VapB family antitoxin [Ammonicoccus fulvus]|uniref:Type II toxin-antitoxin system VapB family antitoxin n=1 Tax=Ammonicoccus fulvus TaxID=3138240 RepID=A0ABZ3FSF9_9ACTN